MWGSMLKIAFPFQNSMVDQGGDMAQQTLPPAFVKQLPSLVIFFLSYFSAALLAIVTKRNDVGNVGAYIILFSNFSGLAFSVVLLYFALTPRPHSLTRIKHTIFISTLCICFTIFAANPCMVLVLTKTIYVACVFYPIFSIMFVSTCLFRENSTTCQIPTASSAVEDCEPADLLTGACSNTVLSIGGMVVNFLCIIITNSTSSLAYSYELENSLVLFFCSNIFGFTAIISIVLPLTLGYPLGKFTIAITKSFTGLSSFLLLAAVVCFAADFVGIYMLGLLFITPVPSLYVAVGSWIDPADDRAGAPAKANMRMLWSACLTLNQGLLMTVLQNRTASTGSLHVAFHLFVIMSIVELFCLQFQMLLAVAMPAVEEEMRPRLFKIIIFLQVGAFCCLGLA